jgi:serine/threonine-protein kinase
MMGTVAYCAPEQIARGQADQRSDVYAAGIVLFELLTGRPPYSGDSAMNVAYQHVHSRVPAPSSQIKGIPNEIDELVISATDSEPSQRPADAGAFLAEIAEIRADLNLPITPIPQRSREARSETMPPVRPMGADTSRTEFLDGSGRTDTQVVPRHAADPDRPPPPIVTPPPAKGGGKPPRGRALSPRQRRRRRTLIGIAVVVVLGIGSAVGGISLVNWYQDWNHHVPTLAGDSLAQATQALKNDGYKLGATTYSYSATVKSGEVISTAPSSGTRLDKGKTVSLVVSRGVHMVSVPSVANLSPSDAETKLTQAGFTFGPSPSMQYSASVPKGKTIGTDPAAGQSVKFGSPLTIIVSNGPPLVNVPTLTSNETFADYSSALAAVKLKPDRQADAFSDTVPVGDVISIDPPDGQLPQGGSVKVTVSKGPNMVTIPDIPAGTALDDARKQLQQLGFQVNVQKAFGGHLKQVVGLSPAAGTSVAYGSPVTITYV